MDILGTLWDLGCASIRQIVDRIRDGRSISKSSVSTVLQRLISRGLVRREKRGVWIYYPAVERDGMVIVGKTVLFASPRDGTPDGGVSESATGGPVVVHV